MSPSTTVSLRACNDYNRGEVEQAVRAAIEDLDGIDRFIKKDQKVLIKPNLLAPRAVSKVVTTHPEIVRAIMRVVADTGAKMYLGDSPAIGSAVTAARKGELTDIADHFNAEVVNFTEACRADKVETCKYQFLELAREALEADAIVNLPKVKTHGAQTLTLGVKNLFGCVVGRAKMQWHLKAGSSSVDFARMLVDIYATLKPVLTVADGVMGMEGNGPGSGTPRKLGWIAAASDAVAMDRVITDVLGVPTDRVFMLEAAKQAGVGETDISRIEIRGLSIKEAQSLSDADRRPFELPPDPRTSGGLMPFLERVMKNSLTPEPLVDHGMCTRCGTCSEACPPQVIKLEQMKAKDKAGHDTKVEINRKGCIHCYCCQELCPEGAITIKTGWLAGLIAKSSA